MWNQQERLLASKQTQLCNNYLLIQWSAHWNAIQIDGAYKHTKHSNLCKDYSREGKQWYWESIQANRIYGEFHLQSHLTTTINEATMNAERNIITIDEYGRIHFPSTTSNDIWMSTNELIGFFGLYTRHWEPISKPYTKAESLMNARCKGVSIYPMEYA